MCTLLKTIAYGTRITPTIAKNIIGSFPERSLLDCAQVSFHDVERTSITRLHNGHYPSISAVLGCTQSQQQLYWWQLKMIKQLGGLAAFRKYMRERIDLGVRYHSFIQQLLTSWRKDGGNISEIHHRLLEKLDDGISGYARSASHILFSLQLSNEMRLEQFTTHHRLCYHGRFDAIIRYKDALFLMDWKTSSSGSKKEQSSVLSTMYNDPLQIAAYIGAVNSDPVYSDLPKIANGAVVVAKESGVCATVVEMNFREIEFLFGYRQLFQDYWQKWLKCLKKFWGELESRPSSQGTVSFISSG
ncbi:unnamed protein product [Dracunculus medinensis]|uniref:PDDEXK_1 domain-containing protein n=1 Tax=Dracunculus medinensis TaxID=318479 RepID=A0A0N4UPL7_DRAME|nr:unnamed protein product [Dracunculus medinensis]